MIKIENPPISGHPFWPLLTGDPIPGRSEVFSLQGNRTRVNGSDPEGCQPGWSRLIFAPLDPGRTTLPSDGKFSEAERDNILCLLASPDGRFGSLEINASVQIYTSHLGADQQITFRPPPGRWLWLQAASGALHIDDHLLSPDEIATVTGEPEIVISAQSDSEFLLLVLS